MMRIDAETEAVIDALLPQVPFDGWTRKAVAQALQSIGQPPEDVLLMFPGGAGEMIEAFFSLSNARMEQAALAADLAAYRVPARVRAILAIWFAQNRGNREAIRRALAWLGLPIHAPLAARITAATVDAVWFAAGDMSADFSWYTKRGILAAVYTATLLYWLRDASDNNEDTLRFLDRRLEGVARIGKARKKLMERLGGLRRKL
jgi:ubiquinone biosynthesis protein COQ9